MGCADWGCGHSGHFGSFLQYGRPKLRQPLTSPNPKTQPQEDVERSQKQPLNIPLPAPPQHCDGQGPCLYTTWQIPGLHRPCLDHASVLVWLLEGVCFRGMIGTVGLGYGGCYESCMALSSLCLANLWRFSILRSCKIFRINNRFQVSGVIALVLAVFSVYEPRPGGS